MGAVGNNLGERLVAGTRALDGCGERWLEYGYIAKPAGFAGILVWEGSQEWLIIKRSYYLLKWEDLCWGIKLGFWPNRHSKVARRHRDVSRARGRGLGWGI